MTFNIRMILLFFCCVGPLALPKKDNIDPWRLAMLGIGSVRPGFIRPKSGSVLNNSFMLKFVLLKPSFTSINCNDEINNHSFQTISNSCLISYYLIN
jgi:hypothetical protein